MKETNMGAREREAVKAAIEAAKTITIADDGEQMYDAAQDQIRRAEKAAGKVQSWLARQSTY